MPYKDKANMTKWRKANSEKIKMWGVIYRKINLKKVEASRAACVSCNCSKGSKLLSEWKFIT